MKKNGDATSGISCSHCDNWSESQIEAHRLHTLARLRSEKRNEKIREEKESKNSKLSTPDASQKNLDDKIHEEESTTPNCELQSSISSPKKSISPSPEKEDLDKMQSSSPVRVILSSTPIQNIAHDTPTPPSIDPVMAKLLSALNGFESFKASIDQRLTDISSRQSDFENNTIY
jgi:hypothetical protein